MAGEFSNIKTYAKGAVIVPAGETSPRELLVVLQGNVGVYQNYKLNNEVQRNVLEKGQFYGEFSLFLNREVSDTLVALSDTAILAVNRKNLGEFLKNQPEAAVQVIAGICKKLEDTTSDLERYRRSDVQQSASRKSSLFPQGHGSYLLPLNNADEHHLYMRKYTCPLCGHSFEAPAYILSRLQLEGTDPDLRMRYKDFEPLYYDIVTCPNCFFSAAYDSFEEFSKGLAASINKVIGPYKLDLSVKSGADRDTFTVFAGYYLAILCTPPAVDQHQLTTGNLWLKLARLYQDCRDEAMYLYASQKALEDYRYSYEHFNIPEKNTPRLCYIMGDLYMRAGDVDTGRNFFHMAKIHKLASNVLKRQADQRLEEIREIKQTEQKESK